MSETLTNSAELQNEVSEEIFIPQFCPRCHYNLKGITAEGKRTLSNDTNCPECGFDFNRDLRQYTIPWMHEDIFPPFKFLHTVLFILFRPGRTRFNLFLEMDVQKAKRFNLYSLILLILTWYAVFATTTFHYRQDYIYDGDKLHIDLVISANIGCLIGLIFMVPLLIDSPLWFCRKSENLNNIRCLGQFGSSPLLLWSPLLTIILVSFFGEKMAYWDFDDHMILHGFGVLVPFLVAMLYFWLLALRLVKASGRGFIATCAIMAALPVIWAAILMIAFAVVPYLFYAMAIMVLTL